MTVEELKSRYEKRLQEHAIAVAKNEQAEEDMKNLLDEAQRLYGISSIEEAEEKLQKIQAKIEQLTKKVEDALDEVGA